MEITQLLVFCIQEVAAKKEAGNGFGLKLAKYFSKQIKLWIGLYKGKIILTQAVESAVENEQDD